VSIERFNNVLVLAPHTDDGEFGCGGTMAPLIENGVKVTSPPSAPPPRAFPAVCLSRARRAKLCHAR
jgi:N-acetylglucosamine malate deacetylase 1